MGMIRRYADYFDTYEGVRVANICGSCGKKAVPLTILGAEVTIFDISEDNKRYALETAKEANAYIDFEVCDVLEIDLDKYGGYFDVVFMEGGVLHSFHDIDEFIRIMYNLLNDNGKLICSDFHPFTKLSGEELLRAYGEGKRRIEVEEMLGISFDNAKRTVKRSRSL